MIFITQGNYIMANLNTINTRIETLKNAERITKAELSALSRELLDYVLIDKSFDIDAVNRTIAVLTPMNKKTACLYFVAMLPFAFDEDTCSFGKMNKKKAGAMTEAVIEWLDNEANDIWSWAADNVKVEAKEVDWSKKISKDVEKAIEAGTSNIDIVAAVMNGGLTLGDIVAIMEQVANAQDKDVQEAA